jgi:hypothetical protein
MLMTCSSGLVLMAWVVLSLACNAVIHLSGGVRTRTFRRRRANTHLSTVTCELTPMKLVLFDNGPLARRLNWLWNHHARFAATSKSNFSTRLVKYTNVPSTVPAAPSTVSQLLLWDPAGPLLVLCWSSAGPQKLEMYGNRASSSGGVAACSVE